MFLISDASVKLKRAGNRHPLVDNHDFIMGNGVLIIDEHGEAGTGAIQINCYEDLAELNDAKLCVRVPWQS